jgi:hypothetical protein
MSQYSDNPPPLGHPDYPVVGAGLTPPTPTTPKPSAIEVMSQVPLVVNPLVGQTLDEAVVHHTRPLPEGFTNEGVELHTVDEFLRAIKGSRGIKITVCRRVGCSRATLEKYSTKYPRIAQALVQAKDDYLGRCEEVLAEGVESSDLTLATNVAKFVLTRQSPEWSEKSQVELTVASQAGYTETQRLEARRLARLMLETDKDKVDSDTGQ